MKIMGDDKKEPKFATLKDGLGSRPLTIWDLGLESLVPSTENLEVLGLESRGSRLGKSKWPWLTAFAFERRLALGL